MVDRDRKNRPAEILDAVLITSQVVSPCRSLLPKKVMRKCMVTLCTRLQFRVYERRTVLSCFFKNNRYNIGYKEKF
jgi:hypothetical protein